MFPEDAPDLFFKNEPIIAKIINVYDGDTFTCIFDINNDYNNLVNNNNLIDCSQPLHNPLFYKCKLRLEGIDTPEIRVKKDKYVNEEMKEKEKRCGKKVGEYIRNLICNKYVTIVMKGYDKYGRVLSQIYILHNKKRQDITSLLLNKKYGKAYLGKKKTNWTEDELDYILDN